MTDVQDFTLSGIAVPKDPVGMLDEICEHFVEHSDVDRRGDVARLTSKSGSASIQVDGDRLVIELRCSTRQLLQLNQTMLAEHLFYFAGEDPLELTWDEQPALGSLPNLHEVTVVSARDVTPHMRRVTFACADVSPFIGSDMHARLLVPPAGRVPVWPGIRADGRVAWPEGDDELLVRVYTIRAVDIERSELSIDFLQHPAPGVKTPGADFARDARPGDIAAIVGPGGGSLPAATSIFLAGDESALPAIARIAAEVPAGTELRAIIEVSNAAEEQPLTTAGVLNVSWLHRDDYGDGAKGIFADAVKQAIASLGGESFVWVAAEKDDIRAVRSFLKSRKHDRKNMYVAWYWERNAGC